MFQFIKHLEGYAGDARVYKANNRFVMVSRADTFDRGDETMIFKFSLASNEVTDWCELWGGRGYDHESALRNWLNIK